MSTNKIGTFIEYLTEAKEEKELLESVYSKEKIEDSVKKRIASICLEGTLITGFRYNGEISMYINGENMEKAKILLKKDKILNSLGTIEIEDDLSEPSTYQNSTIILKIKQLKVDIINLEEIFSKLDKPTLNLIKSMLNKPKELNKILDKALKR